MTMKIPTHASWILCVSEMVAFADGSLSASLNCFRHFICPKGLYSMCYLGKVMFGAFTPFLRIHSKKIIPFIWLVSIFAVYFDHVYCWFSENPFLECPIMFGLNIDCE